jgi:hypothetical protein
MVMGIIIFFLVRFFAKRVYPIAKKAMNKQLGITEPQEIKVVVVNSPTNETTETKATVEPVEPETDQEKEPESEK